ncbi:hypothetical protein DN069_31270 [Streptacidiphilus pinicola]|uniref:HD-CE domain-containing protein n=1 Tax=Streptacidiphilus pinicola TaxID=2219663 RepID=A0A2X0K346_9ACTN|nr:ATP-binding protein [Streptacidiphilus pinicola]RAG81740.1 hypothetical protein DN069_31270 [Streptacidiphilus pinicola]
MSYKETNLWKILEAAQGENEQAAFLLASFERSRGAAALIAAEIARDMPDFTQHDISHIDALWEYADLICGADYVLTPAEIYVLGISFLVHDLANGVAAVPGGRSAVMRGPQWLDALASVCREETGTVPESFENISSEITSKALAQYLREHHAEIAAEIPCAPYGDHNKGAQRFLIDDVELRSNYGYIAGRIASSHWWSSKDLRSEFSAKVGPRAGMPEGWTVDPLVLACILRCADACHLDSRRAPELLRLIRDIQGHSEDHWVFQDKLQKPQLRDGRLVYTSARPFPRNEAAAWWLCRDSLAMVDAEINAIDGILADLQKPRFQAKAVAGVADVTALAELIPTQGWYPIDAQVRASDVVSLVRRLGGAELYGKNPRIALRELISNAADAVRAKRHLMEISNVPAWEISGDITVGIVENSGEAWLFIRDTGVGMTKEVMAGPLLNFGTSYWGTAASRRDLPGLLSSGFRPTGRYGLGFFSAFMLGKEVTVASRRYNAAAEDTMILEFSNGVESRPLLRRAEQNEQLHSGGTEVRVRLDAAVGQLLDIFSSSRPRRLPSLQEVCAWLCPALDVDLYVTSETERVLAVRANDWREMDAIDLLKRIYLDKHSSKILEDAGRRMRSIVHQGSLSGRLALVADYPDDSMDLDYGDADPHIFFQSVSAPVVVGGVRSETTFTSCAGLVIGKSLKAARDSAVPLMAAQDFGDWASDQLSLLPPSEGDPDRFERKPLQVAIELWANPGKELLAHSSQGWMNYADIVSFATHHSTVIILQNAAWFNFVRSKPGAELCANVLMVEMGRVFPLDTGRLDDARASGWSMMPGEFYAENTIVGWVERAIAEGWGIARNEILLNHESNPNEDDEGEYVKEVICEVGVCGITPVRLRGRKLERPE